MSRGGSVSAAPDSTRNISDTARVRAVVRAAGWRTSPAPTAIAYEPSLWRAMRSSFVSKLPPPPHPPLPQLAFCTEPSGAATLISATMSESPACSWMRAKRAATALGDASKASGK